jgi:hypothetical protein
MHESERAALRICYFSLIVAAWAVAAMVAFSLER